MRKVPTLLCIGVFLFISPLLSANQKDDVQPNYKQAELYSSDYLRQRIYSSSVSPKWIGETDRFWYSYKTSEGTRFYLVDPAKRKKLPLFDHQALAAGLSVEVKKPIDEFALSLSDTEMDDEGKTLEFTVEKVQFELDLSSGKLTNKGEKPKGKAGQMSRYERMREEYRKRQSGEKEEEEKKKPDPRAHRNFSPDRTSYVFVQDYNLYYVEASDEVKAQVKAIEERMKKEKEEKKNEKETADKGEEKGKTQEKGEKKEVEKEVEKDLEKQDVQDVEKKDVEQKKEDDGKVEKKVEKKGEKESADGAEEDAEKKEDDVDERERWADDVDESKAVQLTDDCVEDYEFSTGSGRWGPSALEDAYGRNEYGWDELDEVERRRWIAQDDDEDDDKTKKDEERDLKVVVEKIVEEKTEETAEEEEGPERSRPRVSWAPDSTAFYITRRDTRDVAELFLVNTLSEPRPTLQSYSYPMPGEENVPKSELFIFDRTRTELYRFAPKWKDEGYRNVHWGKLNEKEVVEPEEDEEQDEEKADDEEPEEKWKETGAELRLLRRDRLLRNAEFCSIDVRTGEVTVLIEEGFKAANLSTKSIRYLKDRKNEMVWWSERTGWGHYYLYTWDGKLKNPITSGPYRASRIVEIDEEKGLFYFIGNGREEGENVYYEHLYRVFLDGTDLSIMDPGDAFHRSTLSPTNNYVVDNYSRIDLAPHSVLRDPDGREILALEESDLSRLYEAGWKMPETFTIKATDGVTDLYGNLWKPFDFNPKKKYPIIAEVYPGPQTEGVSHTFSASNGRQQLAQIGFIVVQLGHRGGTPGRSKAYHSHGYFSLRDYGLADKKSGLEQLAARHSYIDIERVGIYGHSGGGFMTGAALLREPYNDFFKVGVSSAGNHDNNIYNQYWSETYHGLKEVEVKKEKKEKQKNGKSKVRKKGGDTKKQDVDKKKDGDTEKKDVDQKKDDGTEKKDVDEKKDDGTEKQVVDQKKDDGTEKQVVDQKKDDGTEKQDVELKKDDDTEKQDVELKKDDDTEKQDVELKKDDGTEKQDVELKKDDGTEKQDVELKKNDGTEKQDVDKKKGDDTEEEEKETRFEIHIPTNAELAKNLKGHLLLVHGEIDNNVHPANTMRLVNALIKADKRFDMLILPGQRHGFGAFNGYFNRVRWEYFAEHLLGDYQDGADITVRD
jgi:dipeptidyl-peptidase 4